VERQRQCRMLHQATVTATKRGGDVLRMRRMGWCGVVRIGTNGDSRGEGLAGLVCGGGGGGGWDEREGFEVIDMR
jgi:hypothetical protein